MALLHDEAGIETLPPFAIFELFTIMVTIIILVLIFVVGS